MTNSWITLTMLGALAASGASPDVEPYLTLAGREIRAEGVKLVRIGDRRRVSFTARQAGEYTVGLSVEARELTPLTPSREAIKPGALTGAIELHYPYDWTWRGSGNVLNRRPRLVMPGVEAGGEVYIVDTHELCAVRIEPTDRGTLRARLLKHRYHNDGGDAASATLPLEAGERVQFDVRVFDTVAEANRARFGERKALRGKIAQAAFRGWAGKGLSREGYGRIARELKGSIDYMIVREIVPHAWIPPLFHKQGLQAWHYQYWGALRRHSTQVPDGLPDKIGLRDTAGRLYTAPTSPKGAWLLCDIRRKDVRHILVANARTAIEAGFDGVFLDGYAMWADATGRRGGYAPHAAYSLHHARWLLLREIVAACRAVRDDAVIGVLGNQYYDTQGEADCIAKERMYWSWVKFARHFDMRETRIRQDLDVAFENGDAFYAAKNVAYGFKGYSPWSVQSARHFVRWPTGLNYFGTGDFFPDRLADWLASIKAITRDGEPYIRAIDPASAYVSFEGRDTMHSAEACTVRFSAPVCAFRDGRHAHRVKELALQPGIKYRLAAECDGP